MKLLDMLGYIFVALLVLIVVYVIVERTYSHPLRMSVKDAAKGIASGDINRVVDVRTQVEWDRGHFPGAIHIPLADITESTARAHLDQMDTILVYCNSGTRARQAAMKLRDLGYPSVYYVAETYHEL